MPRWRPARLANCRVDFPTCRAAFSPQVHETEMIAPLLVLALLTSLQAAGDAAGRDLPPSSLALRLTGLIVDREVPARSACLIRCVDPPERHGMFSAGERACDVAEIREVRQDGVVLENLQSRRLEFLTFPGPGRLAPPADARPAATPPPAEPVPPAIEVPKASVERYLANLPDVLESALAVPKYRDADNGQRVIEGFELRQVRPGGAADQLGLRDGDVIQEVNGQPLDGMATVMRLFGQIQGMAQAKVTVLRAGQKITFVLDTK